MPETTPSPKLIPTPRQKQNNKQKIPRYQICDRPLGEGGKVIGRHVAYRVEGVDGYGLTDVVGEKGNKLHIIEAKNGNNPRFTKFQKEAFPKMKNGAGIKFFGPNAKGLHLPEDFIYDYNFEIRKYHQYFFPH